MERVIEVFQVGSPVLVGDKIPAKIKSVCIQDHNYITYECVWWNGNTRNVNWFEQFEISRVDESASVKIGFFHGHC